MTFIKLKKFILASNLQRTYALCGLMILMSNFVTPHAVAENKTTLLDTYVFSTSPMFWGSPIVPVEYDETGDHGHILARARLCCVLCHGIRRSCFRTHSRRYV